MSRSQTNKNNALLGGLTIVQNLYAEPKDYNAIFESLKKSSDVIPEPRQTFIRPGVLTTVKGSAYMEYGNTKILAIVAPPRELTKSTKRAPLGIINCFVNFAAFATSELETVPQREKHLSSSLCKALQPMLRRTEFAGFQLDVRALVLEDDGCVLSTAINCCGVALVECGISAFDFIISSTVCLYRNVIFANPTLVVEKMLVSDSAAESASAEEEERGTVTTASLLTFEQLAICHQSGFMTLESCEKLIDCTVEINKRLAETVKHVLVERVHDQYQLELQAKAEQAFEDQRFHDLIKLMEKNDMNNKDPQTGPLNG